jgi:hypothetical protein
VISASSYVISNSHSYQCASYRDGRACTKAIAIRRDQAEAAILGPVDGDLLAPDRVQRMAKELQAEYAARLRAQVTQVEKAPKELLELDNRIGRLRERMERGDPDMPRDELQAAIDRADAKRVDLKNAVTQKTDLSDKVLSALPRAAALYKRQIALGLAGDRRAADKARVLLRNLFGGHIRLAPQPDGGLIANWNLHTVALLKAVGSVGSGGPLWNFRRFYLRGNSAGYPRAPPCIVLRRLSLESDTGLAITLAQSCPRIPPVG